MHWHSTLESRCNRRSTPSAAITSELQTQLRNSLFSENICQCKAQRQVLVYCSNYVLNCSDKKLAALLSDASTTVLLPIS